MTARGAVPSLLTTPSSMVVICSAVCAVLTCRCFGSAAGTKLPSPVGVDGVVYLQVPDQLVASLRVTEDGFTIRQEVQRTLRSDTGGVVLGRVFEAGGTGKANVVSELGKAEWAGGVKPAVFQIRRVS